MRIHFIGICGSAVCGLACANRLEALQRIFEHEMVHLIENLSRHCANTPE